MLLLSAQLEALSRPGTSEASRLTEPVPLVLAADHSDDRSTLTTAGEAWEGGRLGGKYAWRVDPTAPRLVLPPKCGTSSVIRFINECSGGRVSPKQEVCALDECPARIFFLRPTARGGFAHAHTRSMPEHGERAYGVIRHPVDRLVSSLNYHMDGDLRLRNSTIAATIDASSDLVLGSSIKHPFDSLHDYLGADGTTILCSLDEFASFVRHNLSFTGCPAVMPKSNRSPHSHGHPRPDQLERIARLLGEDMALWDEHCGQRVPGAGW